VAGAGFWIAARRVAGVLAGATGVATAALTFAFPEAAYAWFAFLALGFASVVAALSGIAARSTRRELGGSP
jgi:hypothetical protein